MDKELFWIIFISIALIAGGVVVSIWLSSLSCYSRWERAGMADVSYGPIQGCLVKMPDGRWLPSDRVREMDLPRPK